MANATPAARIASELSEVAGGVPASLPIVAVAASTTTVDEPGASAALQIILTALGAEDENNVDDMMCVPESDLTTALAETDSTPLPADGSFVRSARCGQTAAAYHRAWEHRILQHGLPPPRRPMVRAPPPRRRVRPLSRRSLPYRLLRPGRRR